MFASTKVTHTTWALHNLGKIFLFTFTAQLYRVAMLIRQCVSMFMHKCSTGSPRYKTDSKEVF